MIRRSTTWCVWMLASLVLAGAALAAEAEAPLLRFDPFRARAAQSVAGQAESARAAAWRPVLKAVLVAGEQSLANLGGVLLRLEQETGGYRLVEVRESSAVFELGTQQVTLPVEREARP